MNRSWLSSEGGLYFTMVLRPELPVILSSRVIFGASLSLAESLRNLYQVEAMVKWPNDILIDGGKLAGLLAEMEAESDRVTYVNVGVGLNANNDPTDQEPGAVSLKKVLGREVSRKEILTCFLDEFEHRLTDGTLDDVISQWKRYSITLNRKVKIVTTNDLTEGFAKDVDETGALILELADGSTKRIIYGDCFL